MSTLALDDPLAPYVREARSLIRRGLLVLLRGLAPLVAWMALAPLASQSGAQMRR